MFMSLRSGRVGGVRFGIDLSPTKRHCMPMKKGLLYTFWAAIVLLTVAGNLRAQGTAFSYQGQLNYSGSAANANFDFRFAVFDAVTNGLQVGGWQTNSAVAVSNGLFLVTLDFGAGVFNGTANGSNDWLDISVRPAGSGSFTELTPRQPILPVPYAQFATSASNLLGTLAASQLTGTIDSALVSGDYTNTVSFVGESNTFEGTFIGYGSALTNLNASNLASGTLADARLQSDVALLDANQTYTGSDIFNGPLTFKAGDTFTGSNTFTGPDYFSGANTYGGTNTFTNNGNYFMGSFFGNGLVGWLPVSGTSTNAMRDAGYLMLNPGLSTVTLPATSALSVGDIVRVSGGGTGGWLVKENSSQSILGTFASYRNSFLSEAMNGPTSDGFGVAASSDGRRLYVVGNDLAGVYASADAGQTWNQVSGTQLNGSWTTVACSENGMIVYVGSSGANVEKSINGGETWTTTGQSTGSGFISCTADGGTLFTGSIACSGNGAYRARVSGGAVSYSVNSGGWTTISSAPSSVFCVAASSDCNRLVAGVSNGLLYASANLGATWTALSISNQAWSSVWMSPDGSRLAGTVRKTGGALGGVYTYTAQPLANTANTSSTIGGSQGSAVELQYLGSGQFMPVGSSGLLWSN